MLTFPPEIRNRIYRSVLPVPSPLSPGILLNALGQTSAYTDFFNLIQTCTQIYREASGLFYSQDFKVIINNGSDRLQPYWGLNDLPPPPLEVSRITKLTIYIDFWRLYGLGFVTSPWRRLQHLPNSWKELRALKSMNGLRLLHISCYNIGLVTFRDAIQPAEFPVKGMPLVPWNALAALCAPRTLEKLLTEIVNAIPPQCEVKWGAPDGYGNNQVLNSEPMHAIVAQVPATRARPRDV